MAPISGARHTELLPPVTGNARADSHIRELAEKRGYRPHAQISDMNMIHPQFSVHLCAGINLAALFQLANENEYPLMVVSGYRSYEKQKQIFLAKIRRGEIDVDNIASGDYNQEINRILRYSAVPGYSRHHTGFAVDLQLRGESLADFGNSDAYRWLAKDDFAIARRFGFLPSYPEGLHRQGPGPEPWEFIWVGSLARDAEQAPPTPADSLTASALRILDLLSSPRLADTSPHSDPDQSDESLPGG